MIVISYFKVRHEKPKWPFIHEFCARATMNIPRWSYIQKIYYENDRYFGLKWLLCNQNHRYWWLKWSLWFPKWPYVFQNNHYRGIFLVRIWLWMRLVTRLEYLLGLQSREFTLKDNFPFTWQIRFLVRISNAFLEVILS